MSGEIAMTDKIVVFSTASSAEEAEKIARALVDERLAACVSVLPGVRSVYRWKDVVETSSEWMLVIKSARGHFERLQIRLQQMHSYEVPEVLALSVIDGARNYLNWLESELAG